MMQLQKLVVYTLACITHCSCKTTTTMATTEETTWWTTTTSDPGGGDVGSGEREVEEEILRASLTLDVAWRHSPVFSACSVTCGTGVETAAVHCYLIASQQHPLVVRALSDDRCRHVRSRPKPLIRRCVQSACPWWLTGDWGQCSTSCGSGVTHRPIYCVRESPTSSLEQVDVDACPTDHRPETEMTCNDDVECPVWVAGQWSQCSVTCGDNGLQYRAVVCRRSSVHLPPCSPDDRPSDHQSCSGARSCHLSAALSNLPTDEDTDVDPLAAALDAGGGHRAWYSIDGYSYGINDWRGTAVAENRLKPDRGINSVLRHRDVTTHVTGSRNNDFTNKRFGDVQTEDVALSSVKVEATNFTQTRPVKSLTLKVRGTVTLLAGTTVYLNCPVTVSHQASDDNDVIGRRRRRHRRYADVTWYREGVDDVITRRDQRGSSGRRQRVSVSKHGELVLRRARRRDAGRYTCRLRHQGNSTSSADVIIQFHSIDDASELHERRWNALSEDVRQIVDSLSVKSSRQSPARRRGRHRRVYSLDWLRHQLPDDVIDIDQLFIYVVGDWSKCPTSSCGAGNRTVWQTRSVVCSLLADGWSLDVNETHCLTSSRPRPITARPCDVSDDVCTTAHWRTSVWSDCHDNCDVRGRGVQSRRVVCVWSVTGQITDMVTCSRLPRPSSHRSCTLRHPQRCSPTLARAFHRSPFTAAGAFTAVAVPPGDDDGDGTTETRPSCRDESRYCELGARLNMCHYSRYRIRCCLSCSVQLLSQYQHRRHRPAVSVTSLRR